MKYSKMFKCRKDANIFRQMASKNHFTYPGMLGPSMSIKIQRGSKKCESPQKIYTQSSAAIFFDCPAILQDGSGIHVTSTIF
jgi:hypothetical protein